MSILQKITQLEHDAADFGFQWENAFQILDQIRSECQEVAEHVQDSSNLSQKALQEEIGDLMHAAFSLCVFCQFDPEETLQQTTEKFERRMNAVKQIAAEKNLSDLKNKPFRELMAIWDEAKIRLK